MKQDLREIYLAPSRAAAEAAINVFVEKYGAKYSKAVEYLTKDRASLLTFYDFPAIGSTCGPRTPLKASSRRFGAGRCARKARCRQRPPS
jgi:hypothetical protein